MINGKNINSERGGQFLSTINSSMPDIVANYRRELMKLYYGEEWKAADELFLKYVQLTDEDEKKKVRATLAEMRAKNDEQ